MKDAPRHEPLFWNHATGLEYWGTGGAVNPSRQYNLVSFKGPSGKRRKPETRRAQGKRRKTLEQLRGR